MIAHGLESSRSLPNKFTCGLRRSCLGRDRPVTGLPGGVAPFLRAEGKTMARNRMIKPEFWDDEKLATVSRDARLTFIGLWTYSDDFGVVKGSTVWLMRRIYPYEQIKPELFEKWLSELENLKVRAIIPFVASGEKFYYIRNFTKHQVINKPSKEHRNPEPPVGLLEDYGSTTVVLPDEEKLKEKKDNTTSHPPNPPALGFDIFWKSYPKKLGKGDAEKIWKKIKPTSALVEQMLQAIELQKLSTQWTKDGGQFIPYPATWLNQKRWEDEPTTVDPIRGTVKPVSSIPSSCYPSKNSPTGWFRTGTEDPCDPPSKEGPDAG
jgi:hypothetical protein